MKAMEHKSLVDKFANITSITPGYAEQIINDAINTKDCDRAVWQIPGGVINAELRAELKRDIEAVIAEAQKPKDVKLTINTTPSTATVKFTKPTDKVSGKTITVAPGTTVTYEVSNVGYTTKKGSEVVDKTKSIEVVLDKIMYTLIITTTPTNATVKFNDTMEADVDKSITVEPNTNVKVKVEAEGYTPQEKTLTVDTAKKTENIALVKVIQEEEDAGSITVE